MEFTPTFDKTERTESQTEDEVSEAETEEGEDLEEEEELLVAEFGGEEDDDDEEDLTDG